MTTLLFFLCTFVYQEILFAAFIRILGKHSLKVLLLCLTAAYTYTFLCGGMPVPAAYAVVLILMIPTILTMMAQVVYYSVFSSFFTFFSASNGGKVVQFIGVILRTILRKLHYLLLLCIPSVIFAVYGRQILADTLPFPPLQSILLGAFLLVCVFSFFYRIAEQPLSRYAVSMGQGDACLLAAHNGLWGFIIIDVFFNLSRRRLRPVDTLTIPPVEDPVIEDFSPETHNMMPIDFTLLEHRAEDDPALCQLHGYFAAQKPSRKNDHTGVLSGRNVIFITAESFSHLAIRPDLTPTLYKMNQKGIRFSNCYNPLWGVSTIDGEYVSSTGLLPMAGVWSQLKAQNHHHPFTLANRLKPQGYKAFAFHNNYYDYYRRDLTHPNMGYRYKGLGGGEGGGLELTDVWPQSDAEMARQTIHKCINARPFVAYYMTVSGHLPYKFKQNAQAEKHRERVSHLSYSESVSAYLATQLELEDMLTYLIDELTAAGIAEQSVIAVVSDHYPYGLSLTQLSELAGHRIEPHFEKQRNAMLLYSPGRNPERVNSPVYSADMLPTLLNMLGVSFDSRLLSGRDVFGDLPPLVPFPDRSFVIPEGQFNGRTKVFTPKGEGISAEMLQKTTDSVNARFAAAARILETDYYRILFPDKPSR